MSRFKQNVNTLLGPFIAVNGVTTTEEVRGVISEFGSQLTVSTHKPVLGFLVSFSTLNGVTNFKDSRYPKFSDLPILLEAAKDRVCTVISYKTDFSGFYDNVGNILAYQKIYENGLCGAIKLDMAWPSLDDLRKIKENFMELKILIRTSMEMHGRQLDVKEVIGRTLEYDGCADYIIIEKPVLHNGVADHSLELYSEIRRCGSFSTVGFSGEIGCGSAADLMKDLGNHKPTISITVQDRVRDNITGSISESTLNMEKVGRFIRSTSQAFSQSHEP